MSFKPFDLRNEEKKLIDQTDRPDFFAKPRQIWNTKMGVNIGTEQNGGKEFKRPLLIIKKVGNLYFGLPLTTKSKDDLRHYLLPADCVDDSKDRSESSRVCLGQAKLLDPKRLIKKIGVIGKEDFEHIKKTMQEIYLT